MYTKDDSDSATLVDRLIAAAIAGLCGYFFGALLVILLELLLSDVFWVKWAVAIAFALFGILAPARSREFWTGFWNELLGFFIKGR